MTCIIFDLYLIPSYRTTLLNRYSSLCSTSSQFGDYFDLFQNLYKNNKNYLNDKILLSSSTTDSINKRVKSAFSSLKNDFIATLESSIDIIVPTRIAFENSVNGGNISTMLNCNFIMIDLIMLYHILYIYLVNFSYIMSIFMLLLSFCLLFQILFTLISINIINKKK